MKIFTVIGLYPETGQIFCDHIEARDDLHAFWLVAESTDAEIDFVACIPGFLTDCNDTIFFPGTAVVSSDTVLEQPEIFCL